jgi:hypothetical protein
MSKDKLDNAPDQETSAQSYGDQGMMHGKKMHRRRSKHRQGRKGRRRGRR